MAKVFSVSGIFDNIANDASVKYAFKTPKADSGKIVHLKYIDVQCPATKIRMDIYEAPTNAPTDGSDYVAYNHNRTGTKTDTAMQYIKAGVTFDATGATMLNWQYIPKNILPENDWVLKADTWYVVLFTNLSGAVTDLSFYQCWTEE
jgi:hypothetical protein